jgi:hypothetical protein
VLISLILLLIIKHRGILLERGTIRLATYVDTLSSEFVVHLGHLHFGGALVALAILDA